jgi:hypothetical protein
VANNATLMVVSDVLKTFAPSIANVQEPENRVCFSEMSKNIYQSTPLHKDSGNHCAITQKPTTKSYTYESMINLWFSLYHTLTNTEQE